MEKAKCMTTTNNKVFEINFHSEKRKIRVLEREGGLTVKREVGRIVC